LSSSRPSGIAGTWNPDGLVGCGVEPRRAGTGQTYAAGSARRQPWDARAMRRPGQMLAREPVICAAFGFMITALVGCSAAAPAAGPAPAAAVPSTGAAFAFTVAGARPVPPNGSQDTHAQTPNARCDGATRAADEALGAKVAEGFALAGFPVSADLLTHFLKGKGTAVDYRAGSPISKQALSSSAFTAVNNEVQKAVLSQLKAGKTHVQLSGAHLPAVVFESRNSDLYWGFRGTQGLTVTEAAAARTGDTPERCHTSYGTATDSRPATRSAASAGR
jgi:hypothetical protein